MRCLGRRLGLPIIGVKLILSAGAIAISAGCANLTQSQHMADTPERLAETPAKASSFGNFLAANYAAYNGDFVKASDFYNRALADDADTPDLLEQAILQNIIAGRFEDGEKLASKLLDLDSENMLSMLVMVTGDMRSGRYRQASDRLAPFLKGKPDANTPLLRLLSAWAKTGHGTIDQALETLKPLANASYTAPLYTIHAALITDLGGKTDQAEDFYRSSLAGAQGASLRIAMAAASFQNRMNRPQKAREIYQKYLSDTQNGAGMGLEQLIALGDKQGRPIASAAQGMAEAMFTNADAYRQNNVPGLAALFLRLALALDPAFSPARTALADILSEQSNFADANDVLSAIPATDAFWWNAQLRIAANLDKAQNSERAIALLQNLGQTLPERIEPPLALGDIFLRAKRYEDAIESFNAVLARLGQAVPARAWAVFYSRGIAFDHLKQWDKAEADFLKALELAPDHPAVLNYLGYSWVDRGVNLEAGRRLLEKAVAQQPQDGAIVDSYGWALYRLGRYHEALAYLERAIELLPQDPTINDHLGDALWRVGRQDEARFQWQRVLIFSPDAELEQAVKTKLKNGL